MRHWYVVIFLVGATFAQRADVTNEVALANIGRLAVFASFAYIMLQVLALIRQKWVVVAVLIAMVGSKALGLDSFYLGSIAALFFLMGLVEARRDPMPTLRQFLFISAVSLPVMILQNFNWPDWISYLNTQKFFDGEDYSTYVWPLFVEATDPALDGAMTFTQSRPSGITWSNAYLAFLLNAALFILLFLASAHTRKRYLWVCYFSSIWAMGKVILTGCILLTIIYFWNRTRRRIIDALYCTAHITVPMLIYYLLFPGLFFINLSVDAFSMSVMSRALDVLIYFNIGDVDDNVTLIKEVYSLHHYDVEAIGMLSGMADIALVMATVIIIFPILRFSRSQIMVALRAELARDYMVAYGLVVFVTLLATPLLGNALVWLLSGIMIGRVWHTVRNSNQLSRPGVLRPAAVLDNRV